MRLVEATDGIVQWAGDDGTSLCEHAPGGPARLRHTQSLRPCSGALVVTIIVGEPLVRMRSVPLNHDSCLRRSSSHFSCDAPPVRAAAVPLFASWVGLCALEDRNDHDLRPNLCDAVNFASHRLECLVDLL